MTPRLLRTNLPRVSLTQVAKTSLSLNVCCPRCIKPPFLVSTMVDGCDLRLTKMDRPHKSESWIRIPNSAHYFTDRIRGCPKNIVALVIMSKTNNRPPTTMYKLVSNISSYIYIHISNRQPTVKYIPNSTSSSRKDGCIRKDQRN